MVTVYIRLFAENVFDLGTATFANFNLFLFYHENNCETKHANKSKKAEITSKAV